MSAPTCASTLKAALIARFGPWMHLLRVRYRHGWRLLQAISGERSAVAPCLLVRSACSACSSSAPCYACQRAVCRQVEKAVERFKTLLRVALLKKQMERECPPSLCSRRSRAALLF